MAKTTPPATGDKDKVATPPEEVAKFPVTPSEAFPPPGPEAQVSEKPAEEKVVSKEELDNEVGVTAEQVAANKDLGSAEPLSVEEFREAVKKLEDENNKPKEEDPDKKKGKRPDVVNLGDIDAEKQAKEFEDSAAKVAKKTVEPTPGTGTQQTNLPPPPPQTPAPEPVAEEKKKARGVTRQELREMTDAGFIDVGENGYIDNRDKQPLYIYGR